MRHKEFMQFLANDIESTIEANDVSAHVHEYVVTVTIRPGLKPLYHTKLIRKRNNRRKRKVDPNQIPMFVD
jgi:hypothetical protein